MSLRAKYSSSFTHITYYLESQTRNEQEETMPCRAASDPRLTARGDSSSVVGSIASLSVVKFYAKISTDNDQDRQPHDEAQGCMKQRAPCQALLI
mmetsp:Transcript_29437/g.54633  ORF Transcript_29437/g.54633 Transcript_29437/m.54633 type:complete len:95 (+) Transcript_29437:784-1068(+)